MSEEQITENILFETSGNTGSMTDDDSSDSENELDLKLLRELQRRKNKRERVRQSRNATRKMLSFPHDFTCEKLSETIVSSSPREDEVLNKIRYDIHKNVMKMSKKQKLQRVTEIPITYSKYHEAKITQSLLLQLKNELTRNGFGCEFSNERDHIVKYKDKGVILYLIIN